MRLIAYLRVSTEEQGESGAGLRAQEDACRAQAARLGVEVVGPFSDPGISGATPLDRRPGLIGALAAVGRGDALIVAKRDRLGRDPIIVAMIEASVRGKGGRVVSAAGEGTDDDSPASILMRHVIDGVAEYERLVNKVRTCSALAAKKARGERTGSVPFGFDLADDGRRSKSGRPLALVASDADAATAEVIRELRAEGLSFRAIAAELDRRGIAPKKGSARWSHSAVAKMLARPDFEPGRSCDGSAGGLPPDGPKSLDGPGVAHVLGM